MKKIAIAIVMIAGAVFAQSGETGVGPVMRPGGPETTPSRPTTPRSAKPPKDKKPSAEKTNTVATATATKTNAAEVAKAEKPKERHDTVSIHTNNMGKVVEKWIGSDGQLHMSVRYARKPVFDNASDDQLAMAVGGDGMREIPPIPVTATS